MSANPVSSRLRKRASTVGAFVAALGLVCTGVGGAAPEAKAELTPVDNFGDNPGALAMYSYVPDDLPQGAPLVVAMHGCTQSAQDYYDNSGWKKYADQWKFAVVFPEQPSGNNPQSCFNWFDQADSDRDQGEAASLRQMVAHAQETNGTDPNRVFITGLSAGGGMAANMLANYPDVFAGGSINAGLPAKCARTQVDAFQCMSNDQGKTPQEWGDLVRESSGGHEGAWPRVAIWQGTADTTVAPVNATQLRDQWTNVHGLPQEPTNTESLPGGTTKNTYANGEGTPMVEEYTIEGMEHGLAVQPGEGAEQCGTAGQYYLDTICSTFHTAKFWGLDASAKPDAKAHTRQ